MIYLLAVLALFAASPNLTSSVSVAVEKSVVEVASNADISVGQQPDAIIDLPPCCQKRDRKEERVAVQAPRDRWLLAVAVLALSAVLTIAGIGISFRRRKRPAPLELDFRRPPEPTLPDELYPGFVGEPAIEYEPV
ncbi:hypothetical protein [Sphingomonas sp. 28-63-12]|uniref:hypothetical protein n=1 Tax=Sphingomonas sp. 28-63-12 TaxID=1970434 RepID=UPI000BD9D383|nr:MAG: hypothetical protein B7Y47_07365 [Sphingomonas sp. 28-63-12]